MRERVHSSEFSPTQQGYRSQGLWKLEAAGCSCIQCQGAENNECAQLTSFFLYCLPYPKLREWCHPLLTWVFPPQAKIITHSCAERLVSLIALGSNMLTTKINHHMWQAFYFQGHLPSPVFDMFGYVERSTPTTSYTWDVPGPKLSGK